MSKMNFAYIPQQRPVDAEIRVPLLALGFVILVSSLAWMVAPLLIR
ncbi:MAG TPA: hypothetical protein VEM35_09715 [Rhizomicrobium sp.]|nr:hypothetical protein [Rhizomicrobium sp.]